MYYATTADFRTFSDPVQWIDRKNVIIDTTMLRDDDGWWYRVSKDSEITIEKTRNPYAVTREVLRTDDPNEWSFVGTLTDLLGNGRYSEHWVTAAIRSTIWRGRSCSCSMTTTWRR